MVIQEENIIYYMPTSNFTYGKHYLYKPILINIFISINLYYYNYLLNRWWA